MLCLIDMEIVLASKNKNKIREMQQLVNELCEREIKILSLEDIGYEGDIIEDGSTFKENAAIKASVPAMLGYYGIADDSGLTVDYLNGAPGIYSARYSGEGATDASNNEKLMAEMQGVPYENRDAAYVCAIAFAAPKEKQLDEGDKELSEFATKHSNKEITVRAFDGECRGVLLDYYRGNGGFGYDPMFYVKEFDKTFAETTAEEKNSISHRGKALRAFAAWLNNLEK